MSLDFDSETATRRVKVEGGMLEGKAAEGVWEFLGIPYARPPVGDMRWKSPTAVEPWRGVKPCAGFAESCAQPSGETYRVGKLGEDCLYLNIWVPEEARDRELPVMVWIHGGAFMSGSSSVQLRPGVMLYDGSRLARLGVIVVTLNYRLGPFGFLAHPLLAAEQPLHVSGNYGLLDQIAALKWVRGNIGAFGGDPSRVTLFGHSAGATSIYMMMVSPLAAGLFQRAICLSGPFWSKLGLPPAYQGVGAAEQTGREFVKNLGLVDSGDPLKMMRACPGEEIIKAAGLENGSPPDSLDFTPVVEGWVLPDRPEVLFSGLEQHRVDVIAGWTLQEADYFMNLFDVSMEGYEYYLRETAGLYASRLRAYFEPARESLQTAFEQLITACEFEAPARFLARCALAAGSNAFLYFFTKLLPGPEGGRPCACHGTEIPYVFGQVGNAGYHTAADNDLARHIMEYFTNFASRGNPNGEGLPEWPSYDPVGEPVLEIGDEISVIPLPRAETCDIAEAMHLEG